MGLTTLSALVVGNMIGAGVFTTSGFAMGELDSPVYVLLAWVVGGLVAVLGALSYGALARLMPISGGEYLFLSRALHPVMGFIAGWVSLIAGFTGAIAYAASTFEAYLLPFLGSVDLPANLVATLAILLAAAMHGFWLKGGAVLQNITVAVKLALIFGFILYAFFYTEPGSWQGWNSHRETGSGAFSITAFALTLMWISFSYSGFNASVYIASEAENARSVVPKAMLFGTLLTTMLYIWLNGIFVFAPQPADIASQEDVASIAAMALGGKTLAVLVRLIIVFALFTSISAMVMTGPRVYAKMADDGLLPAALRFRGETPFTAIAMQAVLASIVVWFTGLRELLSYLGFTLSLSASLTVATLFVLVRRPEYRGESLPGYPWAPAGFVLFTLLFASLAAIHNPMEMVAALVTIIAAVAIYYLVQR